MTSRPAWWIVGPVPDSNGDSRRMSDRSASCLSLPRNMLVQKLLSDLRLCRNPAKESIPIALTTGIHP